MKRCPNTKCNNSESYSGEFKCCPICGTELIQDYEYYERYDKIKIGDANAVSGGIHSSDDHTKTNSDNQVHTNSHNTTNNTTIYEAVRSNSDRLNEDKQTYRVECKKRFVNGLISREDEDFLRELQVRLDLTEDLVKPIKEEIRRQSIKLIQPTAQVISGIRQTKSIIELNNGTSLLRQLKQLESWMREYDDDTLKLMYYQMSAILEPAQFTDRYEKSAKNEYWEAYWAYIAYLKQAQDKKSFDARALSGKLGAYAGQPESNDVILHLAGRLMQDDPIDDIAKERSTLTANYTPELKPLLEAIDELLQKNWESETIETRPSHEFYINFLFTNFVETQTAAGKKRLEDMRRQKELERQEADRISRAKRERQMEIKRQKESFLRTYREVQDSEEACDALRLSELTISTWLKEDPDFTSSYNKVVADIERRKAEEAATIRREQELEAEIRNRKERFKSLYEQNNCDVLKTCSTLGIGGNTVDEWRKFDKAFDAALTSIERERDLALQSVFIKRYEYNGCDLRKVCIEMGIDVDVVNNWRLSYKVFDEELNYIKGEYERRIKESFAKSFKSNDCDLRKSCTETGVDMDVVKDWRKSDKTFDEALSSIEYERERRMREAFAEIYKSNGCNLRKSCTEMGVDADDVRKWRSSHKQFDNDLKHLERERAKLRFKKALPYILIVCLLIAAGIGCWFLIQQRQREKEQRQHEQEQQCEQVSYHEQAKQDLK